MSKIKDEMIDTIKSFFGVDGYVRFHDVKTFKRKLNIGSIIELNDSKRGRFYVLMAEARDETVVDQLKKKIEAETGNDVLGLDDTPILHKAM